MSQSVERGATTPPARVLLGENDGELLSLLAHLLRRDGYSVTEAGSGLAMLGRLGPLPHGDQAYDLIITDTQMPGLTGLSLLRWLRTRNTSEHRRTPVILMTASGDDDTHAEARRLGAVLLKKPFEVANLRACANNLIRSRAAPERRWWSVAAWWVGGALWWWVWWVWWWRAGDRVG